MISVEIDTRRSHEISATEVVHSGRGGSPVYKGLNAGGLEVDNQLLLAAFSRSVDIGKTLVGCQLNLAL